MEDLRLVYSTMGGYHSTNGIHTSEPMLDYRRRNSAVEVIFATELERSKPEADPTSLHHSLSSSSFSLAYTEEEQDWELADGYGQRSRLTSFQPACKFTEHNKRDVTPRHLTYTDVPYLTLPNQQLDMVSPQVTFYVDRPPQLSPHTRTNPYEGAIQEAESPRLTPLKPARSPSRARTRGIEPGGLPRISYFTSASVEQEDVNSNVFDYGSREQLSKSYWSQCDMKTMRFPYGSEFQPLGPCPVLSSRKVDMLQYVLSQQRFPETPQRQRATDLDVSSSTESSDSDSELLLDYYSLHGNMVKFPRARVCLSSGSPQEDEEVCHASSSTEKRSLGITSKYFT